MAQSEILLEAGTNELEIIEFFIDEGPERGLTSYGINVAKVLEVIESPGLVPIPGAPHPCFMGTIPLRELVLPVLDLAIWLGLPRVRPVQDPNVFARQVNAWHHRKDAEDFVPVGESQPLLVVEGGIIDLNEHVFVRQVCDCQLLEGRNQFVSFFLNHQCLKGIVA